MTQKREIMSEVASGCMCVQIALILTPVCVHVMSTVQIFQ